MTHTRPSCIGPDKDLTFTHQSAGKLSRYRIRYIHTHTHTHIYTSTPAPIFLPAEKTFKDEKWCTNLSFKNICIYRISEIQSPLSQFAVSWANLNSVINLLASMTYPCGYSMPKHFAHLVDNSTITLARADPIWYSLLGYYAYCIHYLLQAITFITTNKTNINKGYAYEEVKHLSS